MSKQNQDKRIGTVLRRAGLISSQQLVKALEIQSEYTQMNLGEILVLREAIKAQTIDFFADKWPEIVQEGQQLPLGQYLQDAHLLDSKQVKFILAEQQKKQQLFGVIAVEQGWVRPQTIDFFVKSLSVKVPRVVSFQVLEKYNQRVLHLEQKYANHEAILTRILAWTGGNYNLSKSIAQEFAGANFNIPEGREVNAVDQFIEGSLIQKWQKIEAGTYLRYVKSQLLNNKRQDSILLLEEYREILQTGSKTYNRSDIQNELQVLGLVIEQDNQLKPSNLIYQKIFHQDWLKTQLARLKLNNKTKPPKYQPTKNYKSTQTVRHGQKNTNSNPKLKSKPFEVSNTQTKTNTIKNVYTNESESNLVVSSDPNHSHNTLNRNNTNPADFNQQNGKMANNKKPEPITRLGSLITLLGIILFIPLIFIINNYYSPTQKNLSTNYDVSSDKAELQAFCQDLNLIDPKTSLNLMFQLEKNKQELLLNLPNGFDHFPNNCEVALNKLRVLSAPQLGKDNRVVEAIRNLCKVPADSESLTEAKIWVNHWSDSQGWGKEVKGYLELVSECPAGNKLSPESSS